MSVQLRFQILSLLLQHKKKGAATPLNDQLISQKTGAPLQEIRNQLQTMQQEGLVELTETNSPGPGRGEAQAWGAGAGTAVKPSQSIGVGKGEAQAWAPSLGTGITPAGISLLEQLTQQMDEEERRKAAGA